VVGGVSTPGKPPVARNPDPRGFAEHQPGGFEMVQAVAGFISLATCGGSVMEAKFWNFTS